MGSCEGLLEATVVPVVNGNVEGGVAKCLRGHAHVAVGEAVILLLVVEGNLVLRRRRLHGVGPGARRERGGLVVGCRSRSAVGVVVKVVHGGTRRSPHRRLAHGW